MMMNDINFENYLRDLETEIIHPRMVEEENQLQQQNGGQGCVSLQEQAVLLGEINSFLMDDEDLLNPVTPLTAAVTPPNAVMSVHHKPAAAEKRRDKAAKARSTAAHTLSERKRRGRINERMKLLQERIPNSNKSNKATMLDEAIEYVKSAQLLLKHVYQSYMQEMGMDVNPTMASYLDAVAQISPSAYHLQQVPYYNPLLMAQTANMLGPMWDPQLIAPGLYPFPQVQLPNSDQQFYGMQQNQNL